MRGDEAHEPRNSHAAELSDPATHGRLRFVLLALVVLSLIVLCAMIAYPFLSAITWSVALAIIAWPLHRWVGRKMPAWPSLAAGLSTAAVVLLLLVPSLALLVHIAGQTTEAAEQVKSIQESGGWRAKVAEVPGLGRAVEWVNRAGVDVETKVREAVAARAQSASNLMSGSLAAIAQFLATVFILYYLFLDRAEFLHGLRDLLPLSRSQSNRLISCAADSVHAGVYATFVTSLIDSVGSGIIFWYVGLPGALLWAAVMFVLAFLPIAGAGLVWFPAGLFLASSGQVGGAALVLGWGLLTFIFVDNILYFRMVGDRLRMHPVPALIAFLGGIAVFGMSGMVLGPAIAAVTMAFRDVWRDADCACDEQAAETRRPGPARKQAS